MKKTTTLGLLALVTLWAAGSAFAAERKIDETHEAAPRGEVTVELLAGDVQVEAWNRNEVHITGSYDDTWETFEVEAEEGDVSIVVDVNEEQQGQRGHGVTLKLQVPAESRLVIEAISGDIEVNGLRGEATIEAVSGDIDIAGELVELEVECVSGDVSVRTSPALRRAELATVSGDLMLTGPLVEGRVEAEAVNGDITFRVAANSSAHFDVETFNGDITNELSAEQATKSSDTLPAKELSFSIGGGRARVSVESFNGEIRLLRER